MNEFEKIIADYRNKCGNIIEKHGLKTPKTLADAINNSVFSKKYTEHQWKVKNNALVEFEKKLQEQKNEIMKTTNFHELIVQVNKGKIRGIGELTVYDTAERIGVFLDIVPDMIYLHSGTEEGAKILLGISKFSKNLKKEDEFRMIAKDCLPMELQQCSCTELEDILCMYKDCFNKADCDFTLPSCNIEKKNNKIC